jgi:hypothetical protein
VATSIPSEPWVDVERKRVGAELLPYVRSLETKYHNARIDKWEKYAAIYSEQLLVSLTPSRTRPLMEAPARAAALTWNISRSLADTAHSKVSAAEPRPTLLTEGADFERQAQAIEMQRLVDGVFSDQKAYDVGPLAALDMMTLGNGVIYTLDLFDRPVIERGLISEIIVDDALCKTGEPRQMFRRHEMPKAAAKRLFKKYADRIEKQAAAVTMYGSGRVTEHVLCYEAWSLPDSPDQPGRRVIVIDGIEEAVVDVPWTKPYFPVIIMRWQRPTTGFYGIGIIEQLVGIQLTVNKFLRNIDRALTNWGQVKALVPNTSKIDPKLITNDPNGLFIPYDGAQQPTLWTQQILSPECVQWLQLQYAKAHELIGISQGAAHATRDQGIPSAEGQREMSDRQSDRLNPASKTYERAFIEMARNVIDICRDIKARGKDLVVSTVDDGSLHRVNIDQALALPPGDYQVDIFAGNLLSRHPSSKIEQLNTMLANKAITLDEYRSALDMPDMKAITRRFNPRALYEKQIKNLLSRGTRLPPPDDFHPVHIGIPLVQEALFEGETNGVPVEKLDAMREWLETAAQIVAPDQGQDQQAQEAPPQQPQAPPTQEPPAVAA